MARVLLEVEARPDKQNSARLVMTDEGISANNVSFRWEEIDRVNYSAVDNHVNGSYMGTTFTITVGNSSKKAIFMLNSRTKGFLLAQIDHERRDRNREQWTRAVEVLVERLCVRLIGEAVATVHEGGTAELAGVQINRDGVHMGRLFRKTITWQEIAGTEIRNMYLAVMARKGDKTKARIQVPRAAWNAVLLPHVINALMPR
jgi:hypothetical protein